MPAEASRLNHAGAAAQTTLSSSITASSPSCTVTNGAGYPASNFVIKIDAGTAAEEKILCSARSGNTITFQTRGYDGTTATSHGTTTNAVEHCFTALEADDANRHIYTTTDDDHTQYARVDGTRAFTGDVTVNGTIASTANTTRIYCNTQVTLPTNTATQVIGNVTDFTTGDKAPTASATGLTIVAAGVYQVSVGVNIGAASGTSSYTPKIWLQQNSTVAREIQGPTYTTTGASTSLTFTDIVSCAANDVLTYWAQHNGTGGTMGGGSQWTWLSAARIP